MGNIYVIVMPNRKGKKPLIIHAQLYSALDKELREAIQKSDVNHIYERLSELDSRRL